VRCGGIAKEDTPIGGNAKRTDGDAAGSSFTDSKIGGKSTAILVESPRISRDQ
jgi:hypothetical protein